MLYVSIAKFVALIQMKPSIRYKEKMTLESVRRANFLDEPICQTQFTMDQRKIIKSLSKFQLMRTIYNIYIYL